MENLNLVWQFLCPVLQCYRNHLVGCWLGCWSKGPNCSSEWTKAVCDVHLGESRYHGQLPELGWVKTVKSDLGFLFEDTDPSNLRNLKCRRDRTGKSRSYEDEDVDNTWNERERLPKSWVGDFHQIWVKSMFFKTSRIGFTMDIIWYYGFTMVFTMVFRWFSCGFSCFMIQGTHPSCPPGRSAAPRPRCWALPSNAPSDLRHVLTNAYLNLWEKGRHFSNMAVETTWNGMNYIKP